MLTEILAVFAEETGKCRKEQALESAKSTPGAENPQGPGAVSAYR